MQYQCVLTIDEIQHYLADATVVAFDFETAPTGNYRELERAALSAHTAHITGVSFSVAEGSAMYVPLAHRFGKNADDPEGVWRWIARNFLKNTEVVKVAHNLAFEAMFCYARDVILKAPYYDTIAAAQLSMNGAHTFRKLGDSGLKMLAKTLLDMDLPSFETVTQGRAFDELDPQDAKTVHYACADSDATLRLYHLLNGWFDRYLPRHRWIAEHIESPTAVYVGLMKYNGAPVDEQLMREKQTEIEARLQQLRDEIAFMIGDVNIGANASTAAFKRYLYDDLKLPVFKVTAKYQEAMDDEALALLSEWCGENRPDIAPLFALVQEYRRLGKLCSTYIEGYRDHIHPVTSRIHADLLPLATETGRFAARNPNLQNMPRAGGDDIGIRNFFVAGEGNVFLSLDFSQIELRVGAFYCRDNTMLDVYRTGGDIHAKTTAVIYGIPFEEAANKNATHYKERRTIAKNCNFGTFYGLFAKGLYRTLKFKAGLNTSLEECERIIASLKAGYPALTCWQEEMKRRASFRRYIETWLGRRRYLPDIASLDWGRKAYAERCALNTPIQGTAADILKLALGRILDGLPERPWLRPLLQIHDELVFELPEDRVREAVAFVKTCMEQQPFPEFDVPIVAEAAVGSRFGELKELEV
jgi:DNA polymerase-1